MLGQTLPRKRLVTLETVYRVFGTQMDEAGKRVFVAFGALNFGVDRTLVDFVKIALDQRSAAAFN